MSTNNENLDVENFGKKKKKTRKKAFNLEELDRALPSKKDGTKGGGDDQNALFDKSLMEMDFSLKAKKKKRKKELNELLLAEIDKEKGQADQDQDENLDLENFGKKKKTRKKAFNLEELDRTLPSKEDGTEGGGDNENALVDKPLMKMDFSLKTKKKKKKKKALDELLAEIDKEKEQADRDQAEAERHIEASSERDESMQDKSPDVVAGKKQKLVLQPPQVVRINAKKTSFTNFTEICKLLHREPNHVLDFLLAELGTSASVDRNGQLILRGRFQQKEIKNTLRRYIKEYVTCHTCRSPDTILQKVNRLFFLQCDTCGSRCSVASIQSGFQVYSTSLPEGLLYTAEEEDCASSSKIAQATFLERVAIPEWLNNAESPFKWLKSLKRNLHIGLSVHNILTEKFLDYTNQGSDYGFEKYALLLTLTSMDIIYFKQVEGVEYEDSSSKPIDPEKTYKDLEHVVKEMQNREGDVMYSRIGAALEHVLTATRANMLHLQGRDKKSKQAARYLVPFKNMSLENKAGIEGIKAKFIVQMYKDMTVALEAAIKAIELDPDFAYWKYLAAKIMRRHRRFMNLKMEPEELEYFEQAVALERNPKFLVFLAQANQEVVMNTFSGNKGVQSEDPEKLVERAVQLFRECWQLKNDSAPIARRVGNGIMKMRGKHFDFELAKEALHKAIEISPNPVTYHALGKLYLYHAHDEEKALKYLESTKELFCAGEIVRYKLIIDPESDVSEYIESWILIADRLMKADIYYCDIVWYYLCIQPDIFKAVYFFWKILKNDSNCFRVLNFTSYAFVVKGPFNLLEVIVNQVLLALEMYSQTPKGFNSCHKLSDFLGKIYVRHPHLRDITPDRGLLPSIKKSVLEELAKLKRRIYGRTNSEIEEINKTGNWRSVSQNKAEENRMERRDNTVTNWRN